MWRNDIALMLNGYRNLDLYSFELCPPKMELCDFNPNDIRTEENVENISNTTFTQFQVKEALNKIYMERWDIHRNGNPHNTIIIIKIIKGHSLRSACLQPATNMQNSKHKTQIPSWYILIALT